MRMKQSRVRESERMEASWSVVVGVVWFGCGSDEEIMREEEEEEDWNTQN